MTSSAQLEQYGQTIRQQRDKKVVPHLRQYAPVWLGEEQLVPEDNAIVFNVVFRHGLYAWVSRRYRYDGFNDTLYHMGQNVLAEDDALDMISGEPYIDNKRSDTVNAYGG